METLRVGSIYSISPGGRFVFVDESAEQIASSNRRGRGLAVRRRQPARVGRLEIECPVRAPFVVMPDVDAEYALQLAAAKDQHPVEALAPCAANPSLDVCVRVWRLDRCS